MAVAQENRRQKPVFAREENAEPVRPAALPAQPALPATADVEVLASHCDVRVENASKWTTRQMVKYKVLDYGGKKTHGEIKRDFNPVWENVKLEYARVTRKDGVVRKIQPQEINTLDAAWVASAPRYPSARTLVVSLPGVETGAVVEYAIRTEVKDQPMFSCEHAFSSPDAVKETEFSYDLPEHLNPQLVFDFPKEGHLTDVVAGGRRKLSFKWRDIQPQAAEDEAPPSWVDAPDFAMSTGNWASYAHSVEQAVAPKLANQPASVAKAAELAAAFTDPMAKLTAIRDFVARQVRQVDVGFTAFPLASAFSPADVTLKDGYGHDADRAILLHTMLKAAGFDSELALASSSVREPTLIKRSLEVPDRGAFDELVCRVKHPVTGEWLPLDLLSQYARVGTTWLDQQPGYGLDGKPFTWEALADLKDREENRFVLNIDSDGAALITCTEFHHGPAHEAFAAKYREMTPEERMRDFQGLVSEIDQNATPVGDLVTDFTYPGKLEYTVRVPRYAVKDGSLLYFDIPGMPKEWVPGESNTRQRPLLIASETRSSFMWTITVPGGFKPVIQPESYLWNGPANLGSARFSTDFAEKDGKAQLRCALDVNLHPALVPASRYPELLELNRHFSHAAARRVLLR
jgi:hypothetical protein